MTITRTFLARSAAITGLLLVTAAPTLQAAENAMDPDAIQRLQASMDYIATLQTFAIETDTTIEVVMRDGQKLQFDNAVAATVQRPDKFHARRLGELADQEFFYDGKTLTLKDSMAGFHASAEAPDTLEGMLDFARDSLDIVAPAGDFIYSNSFELLIDGVKSARYIGPSYVEGAICDHLAFRNPGSDTDWQIWIERGDNPLPRRIVITSTDILNAPQFTVHIRDWDLDPDVSPDEFIFDEQDNSTEIEFILVDVATNQ